MPARHTLLEIRTNQDAEHSVEAAAQLLSTLPKLNNGLWYKLNKKTEHLSLEIVVENQTIFFQMYVPSRLSEYFQSLITASYPEALISELKLDALSFFFPDKDTVLPPHVSDSPSFVSLGQLQLKNQEYLPLKTYQDFKDIDPLASLLSTLAKAQPQERAVVQLVLDDDGDSWKKLGFSMIGQASSVVSGDAFENANAKPSSHPQKSLIEKKLSTKGLRTNIRIAVSASSSERSQILLETISSSLQAISQSEGNSLTMKSIYMFRKSFLHNMKLRKFSRLRKQHLSLEEIATLYHLPNEKLATIPNIAWGKNLLGDPPENLPVVTRDLDPELKKEINPFAQTLYKNQQAIYGIKRSDRRRHMYVIGKTGTGKSTLLANMAINDLKRDEGLCVIDPHGDLVETLLDYIPSRRINDVVYFNPADVDRTVKINLFEGESVVHRELIASGIVSIFQKLYSYSWGPRLEYILRNALLTLLKSDNARLSDILELLTNTKFRKKIVENLDDPILKSYWVNEFNKLPERLRTDSIAPILNKVGQFVSSPLVRNVVNARKSSFSIEEVMSKGKILLVNLSQGKLGEDNATLLGAMLITKIQLAAMGRVHVPEEERRDFFLYVDEFQNFATDSFNKILSEARKYRLNLTLANQYIAQIPEEVQKAIFGNCGNILSFVMGADDAEVFHKEFGGKYTPGDLVSLGRYQIINKLSIDNITSKPFPANTLPLAKSSNKNREKVIRVSSERYAKKRR